MNKQAIEQAKDRDLRLSQPAMQRAAQRARELAHATGTTIVVSHAGVIEHLTPKLAALIPRLANKKCPVSTALTTGPSYPAMAQTAVRIDLTKPGLPVSPTL